MDSDQTIDAAREAELLANLHNEHIVKVRDQVNFIVYIFFDDSYCLFN